MYFTVVRLGFRRHVVFPDRPSSKGIEAFVTVLCWQVAGKAFPKSCNLVLEQLFRRTCCGIALGLDQGEMHPFQVFLIIVFLFIYCLRRTVCAIFILSRL